MEIWKDIKGYEGYYQISNYGRVKGLSRIIKRGERGYLKQESIIKQKDNSKGYLRVPLSLDGIQKKYFVHRLVGIHFLDNVENKPHINHIDRNPKNNHYGNLEWVTHSENLKHYWQQPSQKSLYAGKKISEKQKGRKPYQLMKKVNQIDMTTLKVVAEYESMLEAERKTGVHNSSIHRVLRGRYKHAGGFYWQLVEDNI